MKFCSIDLFTSKEFCEVLLVELRDCSFFLGGEESWELFCSYAQYVGRVGPL